MEFEPGRNCWKAPHARRVAPIVDAARYYEALADTLEKAQRQVWILGWDFHSRVRLRGNRDSRDPSSELLLLLRRATERAPDLNVRILVWDYVSIFALEREPFTAWRVRLATPDRVHFHFAADHPVGGSHHQKVVVIDDAVAFAGGIDLTVSRWDEPAHRPADSRRRGPRGSYFGPYHDVQIAVDGPAAVALGELSRLRWRRATGENVPPVAEPAAQEPDRWPSKLRPLLHDVEVALARTQGTYAKGPDVREVEAAYVDAIRAAQHRIYIENQYLTSSSIAAELAARLRETDGPEILIVTPQSLGRGIEHPTMEVLRTGFVSQLRQADVHNRLEVRCPFVDGDEGVYVHAKVMVMDSRLLRIGSANLSNRSMALDSECDVLLRADSSKEQDAVRQFRDGLLAEHLGCDHSTVREALDHDGSMCAFVRSRPEGRRGLRPLELIPVDQLPNKPNLAWMDPDAPVERVLADNMVPYHATGSGKRRWGLIVASILVGLVLAGAWTWSSQGSFGEPQRWVEMLEAYRTDPWAPVWTAAIFAVAASCFVPVTTLVIAGALLWSPWVACLVSLAGALASACCSYAAGRALRDHVLGGGGPQTVRTIGRWLERRGVLSVAAIRIVPVAPFTVFNLAAGAARVAPLPFLAGTALGMLPGIIALSWTSSSIARALRRPGTWNVVIAVAVTTLVGGSLYALRRWLHRRSRRHNQRSVHTLRADVARR